MQNLGRTVSLSYKKLQLQKPEVSIKSALTAEDQSDGEIDYQNIFIEDDMIVPVKTEDIQSEKDLERTHLNAVKEPKRLWPKDPRTGLVNIPYVIDRGYSKFTPKSSSRKFLKIFSNKFYAHLPEKTSRNFFGIFRMLKTL